MSSPSLTLLSSTVLLKEEFDSFMLAAGWRVSHQDNFLSGAIDVKGKWTIEGRWTQFEHMSPYVESREIESIMEEFGGEITRKLGALPNTFISVVTYRPTDKRDWPKIHAAAAAAVLGFMQRWPSVCFDEKGLLYDLAEYAAHAAHLTENGSL